MSSTRTQSQLCTATPISSSFSFTFITYQLDFSLFLAFNFLAQLRLSFQLFLVLFWKIQNIVTVNVPRALQIITWRKFFKELFSSVSKKWFRSWSYALFINNLKHFLKHFWKYVRKIDENSRMTITKVFVLKWNVNSYWKPFTIPAKSFTLNVWLASEDTSLQNIFSCSPRRIVYLICCFIKM